ncbi:MAG: aminoglycoside 6-adenylyltransferase [Bacteroidota bacterium]
MQQRILQIAKADNCIRAVLLNGSRANDQIPVDPFQDYDIVLLVNEMDTYLADHSWVHIFGKPILSQLPDRMSFGTDPNKVGFTYLLVFADNQRLDLTLFPMDRFPHNFQPDSLTKVWLDKDQLFTDLPLANDRDYHIQRPNADQYRDHCNEFWWVYPYIAKALQRGELIYAQQLLHGPLREMFHWMLSIHIGAQHDFSITLGKGMRFLSMFLSEEAYQEILRTYPKAEATEILKATHLMAALFSQYAQNVAHALGFEYHQEEQEQSLRYFESLMNGGF